MMKMKKKSLLLLALVTGSIFIQFLLPSPIAVAQTAPPASSTTPPEEPKTCENGQSLGWFLCPVLSLVDEGVRDLDEAINAVLIIRQDVYNTPQLHEVWARLRNLAYIILVPIILVMVIGTAIGSDFISAYSVKKALPRFGVAVIFITLSWPILQFLIGFTNIVGMGIGGLISGPFGGFENIKLGSLFTGTGKGLFTSLVVGVGAAGAVVATASLGVVLSFALSAAIGLFFGYVLLAGRQFLVIALMLLAPLAILAWIFPGNDKLWKAWWGSFSKLLMLYPLIMVLIAGGRVFAQVVFKASGPDVAGPDALASTVLKLAAYIGPFFLIPAVFKFAGGIFATVSGMTNDKTKGLLDRNKKWRGQKMAQNYAKSRNYGRFSERSRLGRGMNLALGAGTNPRDILKGKEGILSGRETGRALQGAEEFKNDKTVQAHQNNDNFLVALMNPDLAEQKLAAAQAKFNTARASGDNAGMNSAQAEIDVRSRGLANAGRVQSRNHASTRLAALNALAKTGYQFSPGNEGYRELADSVMSITGGDMSAYSNAMNEAQFHLKGAGKLDLAGINNGAMNDTKTGVRKLGNYQRGQGKTDTYHGGAAAWLGASTVGPNGKTADTSDAVRAGLEASLAAGETTYGDVAEWHSMLIRDKESATDANKLEIQKQINAMEELARDYKSSLPVDPLLPAEQAQRDYIGAINKNKQTLRPTGIDPSEII